jgi:citrate lyase subunit beta / citryl-CoA lyase
MLRPIHSWLFIPGDSEKMLGKAPVLAAGAVVLDLEDAVAPDQKQRARELVAATVHAAGIAAPTFVRINPLEGGLGRADLAKVVAPGLRGIMLPKAQSVSQLEALDEALNEAEATAGIEAGTVLVAALIETPQGVLNAPQLARGPRVSALCLGGEDLSLALGARRTPEGHELDFARAMLVTAAAAAGVQAIDTVWTNIRDLDGLERECRFTRDLGFTGKLAIHPGQLDAIHDAFAPGPEELALARRIVTAFEGSVGGVLAVDGKMVDAPVVERARLVLAAAPPAPGLPETARET